MSTRRSVGWYFHFKTHYNLSHLGNYRPPHPNRIQRPFDLLQHYIYGIVTQSATDQEQTPRPDSLEAIIRLEEFLCELLYMLCIHYFLLVLKVSLWSWEKNKYVRRQITELATTTGAGVELLLFCSWRGASPLFSSEVSRPFRFVCYLTNKENIVAACVHLRLGALSLEKVIVK